MRDIKNFLRNVKYKENCDINLDGASSDRISFNSSIQKYNKVDSKTEKCADGSEQISNDSLNQSDKSMMEW